MSPFDAVIVGAGPAGAAAAARMSQAGLKVVMIDRAAPGRPRVCGGFLGPEFEDWMNEWGWKGELGALAKSPIARVQVTGSGSRLAQAILPGTGGYAVDRGVFDRWAADLAVRKGARLWADATAESLGRAGGIWTARIRPNGAPEDTGELIYARYWIDATGRRPAAAGGQPNFFACKAVFRGTAGLTGSVALHFVERGHIGLNPLSSEETTLCLCVDGRYLRKANGDLDAMMQFFMQKNPTLHLQLADARRVTGWQTCQAELDGDPVFYQDQKFHVGDAVSMVNPVIGGGIPIAMQSGVLLADFILSEKNNAHEPRIARNYERAWRRNFSKKYFFGACIGAAERSPLGSRLVMGAIHAAPALLPRLVRMSRPLPSR